MKKAVVILAALLAMTTVAHSRDMSNDQLIRSIDEVFGTVYNNPDEPGAAVLIMQGNDTIYSRCFGVADMVTKEPVTFATNFCIASVSKQFSAVALLGFYPWTIRCRSSSLSFRRHFSTTSLCITS